MSVIQITEHDENIYNSTKKATTYHKKSPRHVSKYKEVFHTEEKYARRKGFATMGLPKQPLPDPHNFLKKHSSKPFVAPLPFSEPIPTLEKKSPVPKLVELLEEEKKRVKKPTPNFIVRNAKKVIYAKPKEPVQKVVIDRFGVTEVISRGLEPQYIYSKAYGKTPKYLARLIRVKERTLQFKKDSIGTEQPICRYITRQEREDLLAGLKENWEELQKQYQGLPILTDTIPKIHRKSKMEADLKQLEKDIVLVERHPYIYVYNDNELPN